MKNNKGMGMVEIILILAILIVFALIFGESWLDGLDFYTVGLRQFCENMKMGRRLIYHV